MNGEDFQEVHATEYGLEDTRFFTFVAESSGQPCAIDVRLVELEVRRGADTASLLRWLAAGVAVAGLVCAGGLAGLGRLVRRRPRPVLRPPAEAAADGPPAAAVANGAPLQCPQCRKRLKAAAGSAGKKVKCPGCGAVFIASGA